MRLLALVAAAALAFAAGCDRNTSKPPSPKTDTSSSAPTAAAGSSTTPANLGTPTRAEREGSNPVQQQVDPKHADQHNDFRNNGDQAGPKSSDTAPTMKN